VLDLGTGSGCLLLALLSELPQACGLGIDLVPAAAAMARRNAATLGLARRARFIAGDWGEAVAAGWADVILANPPYIPSDTIAGLAAEVADHEPRLALDGGGDGLAAYGALALRSCRLLKAGGLALFEVGAGQAAAVSGLMAAAGLTVLGVRRDLAGIERCVLVRKR
jgi:release factor glutamine methyltransferase